jgi:hypothetical protein
MSENTSYFDEQKKFWERDSLKGRRIPTHPLLKNMSFPRLKI